MRGAEINNKEIIVAIIKKIMSFTNLVIVISGIISIVIVCLIFVIRRKNIKEEIN